MSFYFQANSSKIHLIYRTELLESKLEARPRHSVPHPGLSSRLPANSQCMAQAVMGCSQEAWHSLPELTRIKHRCEESKNNGDHEKE